ncbi:hypothetical protein M949_1433 [Riemerella anatipestifer CH3]|nr:hypothetical protein M949_1433 [Riemerella anatipestifer CH3]
MEIVIIGSGNVAFHLNNAFYEANIKVSQLFGRNEDALKLMSETTKIPYSTNTLQNADLYIICVKDDVIAEVSQIIKNENALVVHTSGSMPKDALEGNYKKGVFIHCKLFLKTKF